GRGPRAARGHGDGGRPPIEPDREGGLAPSAPANHRDEPEPKDHGDAQTRAARSDNLRSARSAEIRKESDGGRPGHTAERVPPREAPPTHAARPRDPAGEDAKPGQPAPEEDRPAAVAGEKALAALERLLALSVKEPSTHQEPAAAAAADQVAE